MAKFLKSLLKMFVYQVESVVTNIKKLYNKQANRYDLNFYKLTAKTNYNFENINKLVRYDNMTRIENKQISTKTKKV